MRTIELSNHPADQLRKIQQERQTAEEQARSDYQQALERHGRGLAELRQRRDTARAQHRWWAWLRGAVAVRRARRTVPQPPRVIWQPSSQEESIKAGIEGEQQVADRLGRVLGDEWTLLRGYRSRLGTCRNPTVIIVTSTDEVLSLLNNSSSTLNPPHLALSGSESRGGMYHLQLAATCRLGLPTGPTSPTPGCATAHLLRRYP